MLATVWSPSRAFRRVEDVPRYGWPLFTVLTLLCLIGYATVQTGLVDRTVDLRIQQRIAALEEAQRDIRDRAALREDYESIRKQGEFERVIMRLVAVVAEPAAELATLLLIAAVLFGAVAFTGRKAEWHTLLNIVVFAAFIDVLSAGVRLGYMLALRHSDVETSLLVAFRDTLLVPDAGAQAALLGGLLTAVDPFRIWFWVTVLIGLQVTRQMPGWRAALLGGTCWVCGALARGAVMAAGAAGMAAGGG